MQSFRFLYVSLLRANSSWLAAATFQYHGWLWELFWL